MNQVRLFLRTGSIAVALWLSIAFILSELRSNGYWEALTNRSKSRSSSRFFGEEVSYRFPVERFAELDAKDEPIEYAVFVLTKASHPERRNLIRQTWGQNNHRVFFGVAGGFDKNLQDEFEEHQDVVWIDKEDNYENRAYVTTIMIHVLTTHLDNFQYIWKTEDDVYVNLKKLGSWLQHPSPTSGLIGTCSKNVVVVRDTSSKWYVPESAFNETNYPPYSAEAYAVSRSLGECISKRAQDAKFVAPEDALVGILTERCQQTCSDVGSPLYEDKLNRYDESTTTMLKLREEAADPEKLTEYFNKIHQRSCALGHSLASSCANVSTPSTPPTKADDATSDCHRQCNMYTNRMLFKPPQGGAGLNDRLYTLHRLVSIASYLCATVDYPSPFHMLSKEHNNGVSFSTDVEWSDLISLDKGDRNVTMFSTIPEPLLPFERHFNDSSYDGWTRIYMKMYNKTSYSGIEDFNKADEIVTSQQEKMTNGENDAPGFIWILHEDFYNWDRDLAASLSEREKQLREMGDVGHAQMLPTIGGCRERDFQPSHRVKQIADTTWNDIMALAGGSESGAVVGSLTLRRGDAIGECDTELPTVREYLSCSLNGTASTQSDITLLLSSDETNATYRDAVLALANSLPNVKSLDLDRMVQEKLDGMTQEGSLPSRLRDNNYFLYRIVQLVDSRAQFWLIRRRREQCYPCEPVNLRR